MNKKQTQPPDREYPMNFDGSQFRLKQAYDSPTSRYMRRFKERELKRNKK